MAPKQKGYEMTNKLLSLLDEINEQKVKVRTLAEEDKLEEARAEKEKLETMQNKFDLLKEVEDTEDVKDMEKEKIPVATPENDAIHAFAEAARSKFRNMNTEGTAADGGYTVPQDIQTQINKYREDRFSLQSLVATENVNAPTGRRVYQSKANHRGFSSVAEASTIGAVSGPTFAKVDYAIAKYAGYLPVTNELLEDSDANISSVLIEWLGEEDIATRNKLILAKIATKPQTSFSNLDDIKKAVNVTLGQAFAQTASVVTNDDGLNYLDTLKDDNKRYLLQPDINPANPFDMTVAIGARKLPVIVVPNNILASEPVYQLTSDAALVSGKTYYTRTGSGTSQSPYVYTAVASPDVTDIATYYEVASHKVPVIVGDLKEFVRIFDKKQLTITTSDSAAVGTGGSALNAFEEDLTILRGIIRLDTQVVDTSAIVNGYISVSGE